MPQEISPATVAQTADIAREWIDKGASDRGAALAQVAQAEALAGIMAAVIEVRDLLAWVKGEVETHDMEGADGQ